MKFYREILLNDGRKAILRHADAKDAAGVLEEIKQTNAETNYMGRYADEITLTEEKEASMLAATAESNDSLLLVADVDGRIVGTAGISPVIAYEKSRHRGGFGISVCQDFWHLGLGSALTDAIIDIAPEMGFTQIELDVITENYRAIHLYLKKGFVVFGKLEKSMCLRDGSTLDAYLMCKML